MQRDLRGQREAASGDLSERAARKDTGHGISFFRICTFAYRVRENRTWYNIKPNLYVQLPCSRKRSPAPFSNVSSTLNKASNSNVKPGTSTVLHWFAVARSFTMLPKSERHCAFRRRYDFARGAFSDVSRNASASMFLRGWRSIDSSA